MYASRFIEFMNMVIVNPNEYQAIASTLSANKKANGFKEAVSFLQSQRIINDKM